MSDSKFYLRLFLFTTEDNPHPIGTEERKQAINQARMLSEKNVQIELFPLRREKRSLFNVTRFYQEIITFDPDEINESVLDSSSKILDLKERLRQKEFKKRTLNRLLMKVGDDTQIGVKLYALYTKAKKPVPKKVDARTNRYLQRVTKKLNREGKPMF
jgi:ATP-dependent DNA helicase 2 subunit 1